MRYLFLLFIVMPVLEMMVLIKVGALIGMWYTIGFVLFTAFLGANLLKRQGVSTLLRANQKMAYGEIPAQEVAEGFLIALGGALLLTPGFITDAFGFALLVPAIRGLLVRKVVSSFLSGGVARQGGFQAAGYSYREYRHTAQNDAFGTSPFDRPVRSNSADIIDGEIVSDGDVMSETTKNTHGIERASDPDPDKKN
ncbi:MAG: FxsA family protein [Hahellaceae bacterium]|nr:FxsA family protein [Hahellaceae bacterium]